MHVHELWKSKWPKDKQKQTNTDMVGVRWVVGGERRRGVGVGGRGFQSDPPSPAGKLIALHWVILVPVCYWAASHPPSN